VVSIGGFHRTNAGIEQLGFVRGPARLLAAPLTQSPPANIGEIIKLTGSPTNEVQTLTVTGTPTAGNFRLAFKSVSTANIAYNATSAAVQAALEALSTIGTGNVLAAGGPLPASPVTLTFQGQLAGTNQPLVTVVSTAFTGGTTPAVTVAETTPGTGLYDPIGGWFDLGATKGGVTTTMNNTEEEFTIDQQKVQIGVLPNEFTWTMTSSLVEVTPENLAFVWDMGPVTLNTLPAVPEKQVGFGTTDGYTVRRIAVIHRRPATQGGLLRAHFFRKMIRQAAETSQAYASTGDQQTVALAMRGLVDDNVTDPYQNVGYLLDQTA
jgi:hypothetical protein